METSYVDMETSYNRYQLLYFPDQPLSITTSEKKGLENQTETGNNLWTYSAPKTPSKIMPTQDTGNHNQADSVNQAITNRKAYKIIDVQSTGQKNELLKNKVAELLHPGAQKPDQQREEPWQSICSIVRNSKPTELNLNQRFGDNSSTLLHLALSREFGAGNATAGTVRTLLAAGADPFAQDKNGRTALMLVARNSKEGDTLNALWERIGALSLLDTDFDIRIILPDHSGNTALHYATLANSPHAIKLLLDSGADLFTENKQKQIPLMLALSDCNNEAVQTLMKGVGNLRNTEGFKHEINLQDKDGKTLLHHAMRYNHNSSLETISTLLEYGVNVNMADIDGNTALHYATQYISGKAKKSEIIDLLLEKGARVNCHNQMGDTPLTLIASRLYFPANLQDFIRLVKAHADMHWPNKEGNTAMSLVTNSYYMKFGGDFILDMKNAGADINDLLLMAIEKRFNDNYSDSDAADTIKQLLKAGADPFTLDALGRTALAVAFTTPDKKNQPEVIKALMESISDLKKTKGYKQKLTMPDRFGTTAMHHALSYYERFDRSQSSTSNNPFNVVTELIKLGASVDQPDSRGNTVLHQAAVSGLSTDTLPSIDILLNNKASVNVVNKDGTSPILLAACNKRAWGSAIFRKLADQPDADLGCLDNEGQSVLMLATLCENHEIINQITAPDFKHKYNPDIKSNRKITPLHVAMSIEGLFTVESMQDSISQGKSIFAKLYNYRLGQGLKSLNLNRLLQECTPATRSKIRRQAFNPTFMGEWSERSSSMDFFGGIAHILDRLREQEEENQNNFFSSYCSIL